MLTILRTSLSSIRKRYGFDIYLDLVELPAEDQSIQVSLSSRFEPCSFFRPNHAVAFGRGLLDPLLNCASRLLQTLHPSSRY